MRFPLLRLLFLLTLFCVCTPRETSAQNLTGIWRGYFNSENGDQYKFELQVEQNKQKGITGVSYSYLSTVFYGKAILTGLLNAKAKSAVIQEIKTVELRMSGGSQACIMKLVLQYSKSGREEFLEGSYSSKSEKTEGSNRLGGDCGGGTVYLRKVPTSDFYIEPFLRNKPGYRTPAPAEKKPAAPPAKAPVTKPAAPVAKAPAKPAPPVKKPAPKPRTDTTKRQAAPPLVKEEVKKPQPKTVLTIPATTRSRKNELTETLKIHGPEITVRLYDNGEIDDDTISVYLDNQLVLSRQRLSTAPLTVTLKMNDLQTEHVLVMVAENLGRIPPNTSLMIVQDGDKRYQVRITSTEQKNAMVRFQLEE
ncbi:hypothetical protein [Paraflavisolibacter sp. H34]|uniref:hypothetical protein n=1 Tax=Huijunlia imazamoxiresistens TaxID=3127457 RepID=UPI003019DEEC